MSSSEVFKAAEKILAIGWGSAITSEEFQLLAADMSADHRSASASFFVDAGLLRKVHDDFGRFSRIWLIHETGLDLKSLASDVSFLTGLPCECSDDSICVGHNEFVVLYTPTCDVQLIERTQRHLLELENSAVITCYLVARNFVMDGVYLPAAHTPCHFCQAAGSATGRIYGSKFPQSLTAAVKALTQKQPVVGLEYPILASDHALCGALLRNRIREIVGPHPQPVLSSSLLEMCQFSLDGYQLQRDTPFSSRECEFCMHQN